MTGHAIAIANNDIIQIGWSFDQKIPGCIGFSIWRFPADGKSPGEPLHSLPTFVSDPKVAETARAKAEKAKPSIAAAAASKPIDPNSPPDLIREFKWRDLLRRDQGGGAFRYRIFAMEGSPNAPTKMANVQPLTTEVVTSTPHLRGLDAYFNRGILSTQALARSLAAVGKIDVQTLQQAIKDPATAPS